MSAPKKKYFIIAAHIFWVLLAAWLVGFVVFTYKIHSYFTQEQYQTDAIVVLTGGRNRIAESIRLLNENLADRLFISGVSSNVSVEAIEDKAKIKISDPSKVELGYKAKDTIGNAHEIKEWIENNHINSIRLVTSNYHMPRSLVELRASGLTVDILPHAVYSDRISEKWWQSWGTFKFIYAEYNKFLYAYLRNLI